MKSSDNSGPTPTGRFKIPAKPKLITNQDAVPSSSEPSPDQIAAFADGALTRSTTPPPATFFSLRTEPLRNELVVVKGQIKRGDVAKSSYLMIPGPTISRLEKVMMGALTPGIIGLIEFGLDELERQGLTLVIDNHK